MKNMFISNNRKVTVITLLNDKIQAELTLPYVVGLHFIVTNPFYFYLYAHVCEHTAGSLGQTLPTAKP